MATVWHEFRPFRHRRNGRVMPDLSSDDGCRVNPRMHDAVGCALEPRARYAGTCSLTEHHPIALEPHARKAGTDQ